MGDTAMTDLMLQPLFELRSVSRYYGGGTREVRAVDASLSLV